MKKNKIDLFVEDAINMMLAPHGLTMQDVIENPVIDGLNWYEKTWTSQQEEAFRLWFYDAAKKRLRWNKKQIEREYDWFNFIYGLKNEEKNICCDNR